MNRYNSATEFYKKYFNQRVQKISIDAGFSCPNRDGAKSVGGCDYCDNNTFKPFYCSSQKSITQQLNEGIAFFSPKYKTQKYLAYFQAFSNTYASVEKLEKMYSEAVSVDGVVGLVISTRPDCIDPQKLDLLKSISEKYFVLIEFGIESTNDNTLELINRKHTLEETKYALNLCSERNLLTGIHLIMGLPNESRKEMIERASEISKLNFNLLKLHQLQIVKNTKFAIDFNNNPEKFKLFLLEEYIDFVVKFLEKLSKNIIVERFTSEIPIEMLIAPKWGKIKNYEIVHKIQKKLEDLDTWQGRFFN